MSQFLTFIYRTRFQKGGIMETIQMVLLICAGAGMFILMGVIPLLANNYSLNFPEPE